MPLAPGTLVAAAAAMPAQLTAADALSPPNVSISIDSGAPVTVTVPVSSDDLFFNVTDLAVGQHTVKFTVLNFTDDFPFALDAIVYAGPTDVTVPIGSSVSSQDAGTSGFLQGIIPADLEDSKSSGPPVGPIVGGVIGGTALLAMLGLVVWYLFIRPRRRGGRPFFYAPAKISDMLSSETGRSSLLVLLRDMLMLTPSPAIADAKPDPYPLMAPTNGAPPPRSMTQTSGIARLRQPTLAQSDVSLEYGAAGPGSVSGVSGYGYGVGMGATPLSMSEEKPPQSKAELAAGYTTPAPATFHADSGIRFPPPAAAGPSAPVLSDVPPTYSEK